MVPSRLSGVAMYHHAGVFGPDSRRREAEERVHGDYTTLEVDKLHIKYEQVAVGT